MVFKDISRIGAFLRNSHAFPLVWLKKDRTLVPIPFRKQNLTGQGVKCQLKKKHVIFCDYLQIYYRTDCLRCVKPQLHNSLPLYRLIYTSFFFNPNSVIIFVYLGIHFISKLTILIGSLNTS